MIGRAAILAACLSWPAITRAQTCAATTTGVAFGSYAPMGGGTLYTLGTTTVTCSPGSAPKTISYTIALGTGASGSYSTRTLTGTATPLDYQIYADTLYSTVWGDGSAGTVTVSDSYLLGITLPISRGYVMYGRALSGQNVNAGAYTDTVSVLVSY